MYFLYSNAYMPDYAMSDPLPTYNPLSTIDVLYNPLSMIDGAYNLWPTKSLCLLPSVTDDSTYEAWLSVPYTVRRCIRSVTNDVAYNP